MNKEKLLEFEAEIAQSFNSAEIRAPIHLHGGNEEQLINIFKNVKGKDWVFSSWRSHYHCLLKGVPRELLMKDIKDGKSITLMYPEYKVYTSAIVGGIIPIALGTALAVKNAKKDETIHLFIGEMTSETGAAHEAHKYAVNHDLPIKIIIEDNRKSVCTETYSTWKLEELTLKGQPKVIYYEYELPWPHAGAGKRVQF